MPLGLFDVHHSANSSDSREKRGGEQYSDSGPQDLVDVWRQGTAPCHAVIIDLTAGNTNLTIR